MRCEVGAFVMSKRRKTRAMRRGKERGAAPKKSPVVLVRRGGELEKRRTMAKKQPCFAKKCSTFAQKFPCFQRVPPILRRAVLDFAPEVEHLSSDERVLSFGRFVRRGVHVPYFAALLYDEWAASFAEKSAPSASFWRGMSEKERKVGCSLGWESRVATPFALTAHREGSRLGSKQPEIVCRVKKRRFRAVLLPR